MPTIDMTAGMDRELAALREAMKPPVTEAERLEFDRALNAAKAAPTYHAASDRFALEQQIGGAL